MSIVSGCLLLALVAELYYFFWWKRRRANRDIEQGCTFPSKELPYLFCWNKPCFLTSTALNPQEIHGQIKPFGGDQDAVTAELMCLAGPPRSLYTIEEETQEELESEVDKEGRKGSSRGSLRDLLLIVDSPTATSPPTPTDFCKPKGEFNPLFEPSKQVCSSPPPTLKFLRDAEEKLYRRTLREEALKVQISSSRQQNQSSSSLVIP